MTDWGIIVGDRRAWVRDITITAGSSLVFALLGPFGTDRIPLQQRVIEYFAIGFASFVLLWPPMRLALRLGDRNGVPELFVVIGGLAILTLPATLVGGQIVHLFSPSEPPMDVPRVYFMILSMVLPFGAAYLMVERRLLRRPAMAAPPEHPTGRAPGQSPELAAASRPKLLARLSPRLGGEVIALQGEDHYVRVHTALGSELLLMRLTDAIDGLDGIAGERVQRSWWVARDAVAAVRVDGRRVTLTLSNGLDVPVSRDATPRLRRAGWLRR